MSQIKEKPSTENSNGTVLSVELPYFQEISLCRQSNAALSLLLHFPSL